MWAKHLSRSPPARQQAELTRYRSPRRPGSAVTRRHWRRMEDRLLSARNQTPCPLRRPSPWADPHPRLPAKAWPGRSAGNGPDRDEVSRSIEGRLASLLTVSRAPCVELPPRPPPTRTQPRQHGRGCHGLGSEDHGPVHDQRHRHPEQAADATRQAIPDRGRAGPDGRPHAHDATPERARNGDLDQRVGAGRRRRWRPRQQRRLPPARPGRTSCRPAPVRPRPAPCRRR